MLSKQVTEHINNTDKSEFYEKNFEDSFYYLIPLESIFKNKITVHYKYTNSTYTYCFKKNAI
jgi:hypothetical protein